MISIATDVPQPAIPQSQSTVTMPESSQQHKPHTIIFAHDSPRASYIPLDGTEHFGGEAITPYPRTPPQAARSPLQVATPVSQPTTPISQATATPRQTTRPVDFANTKVQPSSPNINISVSFMNPNGFPQAQPSSTNLAAPNGDVSLDRGHFSNPVPFSDHQEPTRYNGLSWHMGPPTPSADAMSRQASRRSLHTVDSDTSFKKDKDVTMLTRVKRTPVTTILLAVTATILVVEEWVLGAVWALVLSKRVNGLDGFARGYFESKARNFVGAVLAAVIGLSMQWFLHSRLAESRIALQLWSFILIFLTYMGCCLASGVARRLEY